MVTTRRNSDDDVPNFEAMIALLWPCFPNLTARGGGGDATPQGIHVWIERFTKLKPLAFRSAVTPAEAEDWITHMEKLFQVLGSRLVRRVLSSGVGRIRGYDSRRQDFQGQDQRFNGRNGNDRQCKGNYNQRQHRGQSTRDFNQGHVSGSAGQRRFTETLPPPPLCTTCGKPHPGVCYKATGGCFTCGSTQHKVKDVPKRANRKQNMPTDFGLTADYYRTSLCL
ncbi:hypothetical protein Tco_0767682 [Tanacetum coccineum]